MRRPNRFVLLAGYMGEVVVSGGDRLWRATEDALEPVTALQSQSPFDVVQPSSWLLAYWMGRFHGFIAAPTVTDPALLSVEQKPQRVLGAKPYAGPARPTGF